MSSPRDREKAQRDARREQRPLDQRLTDWWAYVQLGGLALILGAFILYLVFGMDMQRVLSTAVVVALTIGAFWLLRRTRKPHD